MQEDEDKDKGDNKPSERGAHQIFDRIFKRLMNLSPPVIVQFINGLFGEDYPIDSSITFLSTEYVTESLERFIADMRVEVAKRGRYLLEIQMSGDAEMALRVFNYEYLDAVRNRIVDQNVIKLDFSRCIVIYLEPDKSAPDELIIEFTFPDRSEHRFTVPTFLFWDCGLSDIEKRALFLLLPFYPLKLRRLAQKAAPGAERLYLSERVKGILEEILEVLDRAAEGGLMSRADARAVADLTLTLYDHLYKRYPEFKETNEMVSETYLTVSEQAALEVEQITKISTAKEIAQNLLKRGLPIDEIAEITSLDIEVVEELYNEAFAS
jgi:hypothetical protein